MSLESELPYPPPPPGIEYHLLDPNNPKVLQRAAVWVHFPSAFCREAMDWYPHWYQEELLDDKSLFIACTWSRQIGKSETVARKAIHTAFTKRKADVLIIAPGRRQAQELYRKVVESIKSSPLISRAVVGKPTQEQTVFRNGSRIINLPAGDEGVTIRGYSISLLIYEEAAFIPDNVVVAVEQGLSATGGSLIMISTPRGRSNAFYRTFNPTPELRFDMSKEGRQQIGHYSCYRYSYRTGLKTIRHDGTPQLSEMHIDIQRQKLPKWRFDTEYEALFVEDIDSYWPQTLIDATFNKSFTKAVVPQSNANYFMGIDIAKGHDFTAVTIAQRLDFDPYTGTPLLNPHISIVKREYWKIGGIEAQYPLIIALVEQWKPIMVFFDKTSIGERPFEELTQTYKLPMEGVNFSGTEKVSMYGTLTLLMSMDAEIKGWKKRIQSYYDEEAKHQYEMMIYEIPLIHSRQTGITHPGTGYKLYAAKGNDDIPDADALACRCISSVETATTFAGLPSKPTDPANKLPQHTLGKAQDAFIVAKTATRASRRPHSKIFW